MLSDVKLSDVKCGKVNLPQCMRFGYSTSFDL